MQTIKKVASIFLCITMIASFSFTAIAASNRTIPTYGVNESDYIISPYYVNINTTYLSRGDTWIYADCTVKAKMSLRIDIKVYKNGSLDYSDYATTNDTSCALDVDYDFESGVSYKIEAIYKAGTETVPKSMSFTQK